MKSIQRLMPHKTSDKTPYAEVFPKSINYMRRNNPRSFFSCITPLRSLADAAMPASCSNDFPNLLEKTHPSR